MDDGDDGLYCMEVNSVNVFVSEAQTKLQQHLSSGHILCPPGFSGLSCPDCSLTMGVRGGGSHPLVREAKTSPGKGVPMAHQVGSFYGPLEPPSVGATALGFHLIVELEDHPKTECFCSAVMEDDMPPKKKAPEEKSTDTPAKRARGEHGGHHKPTPGSGSSADGSGSSADVRTAAPCGICKLQTLGQTCYEIC